MSQRAIVTACSGDAGFFEAFLNDWCQSLRASTDLSGTDVWLIDYGLTEAQRRATADRGVHILTAERNGSVPNLRWRDLPGIMERGGPYTHVMVTDGSDMYFQRDVGPVFEIAHERIAAAHEHYGHRSRDIYLERVPGCLTLDELRFLFDKVPVNSGLVCGPGREMLELCDRVMERITETEIGIAGPDYVLVNLILHTRGFEPLDESFNFVAITSRRCPEVIDGRLCSGGEPVHVIHNAAAGFGVFEGFGFPNASMRLNRRVLGRLRRAWIGYALKCRIPLLRRFTWSGRTLARGGPPPGSASAG